MIPNYYKNFITKANEKYHYEYDYSLVDYKNAHEKIIIICAKHGEFYKSPNKHLNGQGCPFCSKEKRVDNMTTPVHDFIRQANHIHNNKYDYTKSKYITAKIKIIIICPEHGNFCQMPDKHLKGQGCPICGRLNTIHKITKTKIDFLIQAIKIHNNKYDYTKLNYINDGTKVIIICPSHGEFQQTPNSHLQGHGCPKCKSSRGETIIRNYLKSHNVEYNEQVKFDTCKYKKLLIFDFVIYDEFGIKTIIEYQGQQHFIPITFGGISMQRAKENLLKSQYRDKIKKDWCLENNINLWIIKYDDITNINLILTNIL